MANFRVDDESGDRKYFTMVPNYILNHSGVIERGVYIQMKRHAGEHGSCFVSRRTMCKKLGIGKVSYDKAVKYLLEHEWIYYKGKQLVSTAGGEQLVNVYGIRDLWKFNEEHYSKGGAGTDHPEKVVLKNAKVVLERPKGGAEMDTKKITLKKNNEEDAFKKLKEEMAQKFPSKR